MFTLLEDLPNELILEIFDYTKIRDLSLAFWNLNLRFNHLICSLKYLSLILTKPGTYESLLFSQQITRLVIVTLDHINLTPFINLRSLILNWANENHLKQIRSDLLPNLVYLSIPISINVQSTKQLALDVFSNQFPSLRHADLDVIDLPELFSWRQSPSLHSINIFSPNVNIIPLILQSCPQLTHLQIRLTDEHILDISSLPLISNHPLNQFTFLQSQNSLFVYDITNILILIPNLKRIDLRLCTSSFLNLIQFTSEHLIYLTRFDCHIIESPNTNENININLIRRIHPCYTCIQCTLREDCFCLYTSKNEKKIFL